MSYLVVCNKALNYLSKISLEDYKEKKIPLDTSENPIEPSGVGVYKGIGIIANNHSRNISLVDFENNELIEKVNIGAYSSEIKIYKDNALFACNNINSLIVMDLTNNKVIVQLPLDGYPYSIALDEEKGIAYISNFLSGSISIVDCEKVVEVYKITNLNYPTKIILSKNNKFIYVLESFFGSGKRGNITIIDKKDRNIIKTIPVSLIPIDIIEKNEKLYVCNFDDGIINVIDLKSEKTLRYNIFGMPNKIINYENEIICSDYLSGRIKLLNFESKKIKTIAIGDEPSAMIII